MTKHLVIIFVGFLFFKSGRHKRQQDRSRQNPKKACNGYNKWSFIDLTDNSVRMKYHDKKCRIEDSAGNDATTKHPLPMSYCLLL